MTQPNPARILLRVGTSLSLLWVTYLGRSQVLESALSEPPRDTRNRLPHFIGRTRVGKADELTAPNRIEIDAGCRRDVCLLQHFLCKLETVGGEFGDIRVQVKRTVGGQEFVEPRLRQALDQNAAVFQVAVFHRFHFLTAFECSL